MSALDEQPRFLSPTHRRIYTPTDDAQGVVTASQLQNIFGWKPYMGTAKTNKQGFVIEGSDPKVTPLPVPPIKQ